MIVRARRAGGGLNLGRAPSGARAQNPSGLVVGCRVVHVRPSSALNHCSSRGLERDASVHTSADIARAPIERRRLVRYAPSRRGR